MADEEQSVVPVPSVPEEIEHTEPAAAPAQNPKRQWKVAEAFWRFATLFSFAVNIVLVIVLIVVAGLLFEIKQAIATPLIGGLHSSFVEMDRAHITTSITVSKTLLVSDTIPVVFDLPLQQNTTVILVNDTPVKGATIYLNDQPVPLDLVLKQGTPLGISLNLTVPVSQTVPVVLNVPVNFPVPVDIALDATELHSPFTRLAELVGPYDELLKSLPSSWAEVFGGK